MNFAADLQKKRGFFNAVFRSVYTMYGGGIGLVYRYIHDRDAEYYNTTMTTIYIATVRCSVLYTIQYEFQFNSHITLAQTLYNGRCPVPSLCVPCLPNDFFIYFLICILQSIVVDRYERI